MPENDAMSSDSKTGATGEAFGADAIERMMRERIREAIEGLVAEDFPGCCVAPRGVAMR